MIGKPPSNRTSTSSLARIKKTREEPRKTVSDGRVRKYGSRINFNAKDELGPWKVKGKTKNELKF